MSLYTALTETLSYVASKLNGIKTGYNGTVYNSPGEAVREQINDLHVLIGNTPGTAIQASAVAYNDSNVAAELTAVNGRLHELITEPELRNGTALNTANANAVATAYVLPYDKVNSVKIKINKPLKAEGNYYRIVVFTYDTYGIASNGNNAHIVSQDYMVDNVKEITLYRGLIDNRSVGFAFTIVERTSEDATTPLRITDFSAGDVVVILDNAFLDVIKADVAIVKNNYVYTANDLTNMKKKHIQYLPPVGVWQVGYWDGKPTAIVNNQYRYTSVFGLKAGTYYVTGLQEWQSLIENIDTGEIKTFHALGLSTNTPGSFTVDYNFNLYVTTSNVNTPSSMFANTPLPPIWRGGEYDTDGDTFRVEKSSYGGEFTSLVDAINYATQFMDSTVYVGDGEWDILSELGDDYLATVGSTKRGIYLKNRIHLICSTRSKITANYTGDVSGVKQWLSIFNTGEYGFTLENATLEGSNIRYIIHDERDQDADAYTNKYINTSMYFDNSGNDAWNSKAVIGGGLGRDGYILIDGCIFESVGGFNVVTYHNTGANSGKSTINIRNCYFKRRNTIRLSWYGTSTEITKMYVCGCYLGLPILVEAENSSATVENVALTKWGNTELPA